MKRITALITAAVMSALMVQPVFASSFPQAFWGLSDTFLAAQSAGDDDGIISAAKSICELLEGSPKNSDTIGVLGTRYQDIALAYERKGDFISAAQYFEKYLPYGRQLGWDDGVRIAEAKSAFYQPVLQTYMETDSCPVYYGAKNEPKSGVLYGQVAEQATDSDSMVLLYVEFGTPMSGWTKNELEKAAKAGKAVELALNFPQQGATAAAVPQQSGYINEFLNDLKPYTERTPVFLRIGAEMDVWGNLATPETFITAYRTIADAARQITPNAALVWSPNHVSGWDTDASVYYPGDEYVDWVGVSAYMVRYFQNKVWDTNDRIDEIMFTAGRAADPVFMVKKIVEKYGDRKPIMIAEGGASHRNNALGMDSTDWATKKLREYYGWLPMVYPQIKLMAYFNNYIQGEANNYALKDSSALLAAFSDATSHSTFIKGSASATGTSFVKLDGQEVKDSFTVASHAHYYEKDNIRVEYYVDDQLAASSTTAPYRAQIDAPGAGNHTIRTVAYAADGSVLGESRADIASGNAGAQTPVVPSDAIKIMYNGVELVGDVPAMIIDGRTMVPLRLIFNAMGADVIWEESTKTISSTLGDTTVEMQVDNKMMDRNGTQIEMDVPPMIIDSRTLVPVRAVAEAFGAEVGWEPSTRTVIINF